MTYSYIEQKPYTLTDEGQRKLLAVRDCARDLCTKAGAVRAGILLHAAGSGDSWENMALVDRLVEIGDLRVVHDASAWQDRIFTWRNQR